MVIGKSITSKHLSICCEIYIFSGNIVLSIGGRLQLGRFCRASSTRLAWMHLYQGVFISINAIYDFILLFFCSIFFFLMMQQIWYGWRLLCRREGALTSWSKMLNIELDQSFLNWLGQQGSSSSRHLQGFPGRIYRLVSFFQISIHWHLLFFIFTLKSHK